MSLKGWDRLVSQWCQTFGDLPDPPIGQNAIGWMEDIGWSAFLRQWLCA